MHRHICRYTCPNHPVSGSSRNKQPPRHVRGGGRGAAGRRKAAQDTLRAGANDRREWERCRREPAAASHCICSLFQQLPSRTCAHKANTQEQRYLAAAWPTNAMRDPRRGAATEMGRGEHATAVRETYRERLVALPHRARSPTAPSAPKLDHALGRPHHRRARGFSAASRRTPREAARTMAPRPQAYADGPWAGGHSVSILPRH